MINVNYDSGTIRFAPGCDCISNSGSGFPRIVETFNSYPEWNRLLLPNVACGWSNFTIGSTAPQTTVNCLLGLIDFFNSAVTVDDTSLATNYLNYVQANWFNRPTGATSVSKLPTGCQWPLAVSISWYRYANNSTNALIALKLKASAGNQLSHSAGFSLVFFIAWILY